MLKIGITGGIGSGKTTVSRIFQSMGIAIYNADLRARQLMESNAELISDIKKQFGDEAYVDGKLNRGYISSIVFKAPEQLSKLNQLVHPAVNKDFDQWEQVQEGPYTLKEAALLFESGSYKNLDKVIVVTAPEAIRVDRTVKRDNISIEQVRERMSNQMPQEEKEKLADFIIVNDGQQGLISQVDKLHQTFVHLASS